MTITPAKKTEPDEEFEIETYHEKVIQSLMGPIRDLYNAPETSEIMINGYQSIYIEKSGKLEKTEQAFETEEDLISLARSILQYVGKRLTPEELSLEARLPNGSRVHILQGPASRPGLSMAIRKFPDKRLTMRDLVDDIKSLTSETEEFLIAALQQKLNIIISGGTGSGKTTILNILSEFIGEDERIIIIEDATEIQPPLDRHVLQLETVKPDRQGLGGVTIRDLVKASLRMRPDRIIVGECRAGEAIDMIQAMNTGHDGSMSTVHANSPLDCLARLETLCLMSEVNIPLIALQRQMASAINVIIQIARHDDVRRVTEISEIVGFDMKAGEYILQPLFTLKPSSLGPKGWRLAWTGKAPVFGDKISVDRDALVKDWVGP